MDINKNSYKVLEFINKHSGSVPYEDIFNHFSRQKNPVVKDTVNWLNNQGLIKFNARINENGFPTDITDISITIKGKNFIEERFSRQNSDMLARIVSIIALLLSFTSIIVSIMLRK